MHMKGICVNEETIYAKEKICAKGLNEKKAHTQNHLQGNVYAKELSTMRGRICKEALTKGTYAKKSHNGEIRYTQ